MLSLQRDYLKRQYDIDNNTLCATASHCCNPITLLACNVGTNSWKFTSLLINKYVFTTHNELSLRRPRDITSSGVTAAHAASFARHATDFCAVVSAHEPTFVTLASTVRCPSLCTHAFTAYGSIATGSAILLAYW